jgi:hypothetical protein
MFQNAYLAADACTVSQLPRFHHIQQRHRFVHRIGGYASRTSTLSVTITGRSKVALARFRAVSQPVGTTTGG